MNVGTNLAEEKCTGCGACVAVCPKQCVSLKHNIDGYWKREVYHEDCIHCNKCIDVCSALCGLHELKTDESYVAYANKIDDRKRSSSGGVAYILSKIALDKGYSVAGAVWDLEGLGVKHIVINEKGELLERMRSSKYIQSNTLDVFRAVQNNSIIFGTPCQIQAFRNVYGEQKDILYVGVAGMGGGGYNLLEKYVKFLSNYNSSGIKEIRMRDKKRGWMNYGTHVFFNDGSEYYQDKYKDPFCQCFNFGHAIQNLCMDNCRWGCKSAADIRIGDAWEYADAFSYKIAKNGLSSIFVQTKQGRQWVQRLQERMILIPVDGKKQEACGVSSNEFLLEMLRDHTVSIEEIVKFYHSVSLDKKIVRAIERILSRNYYVYLVTKRIKKWYCLKKDR